MTGACHVISDADWPGWVADSVVRGVVLHRTPRANASRIEREGFRVEHSQHGNCQGVYFSAFPWTMLYADVVELRAVVRLRNPVRVTEVAELPEVVGLERGIADPREVRERLLAVGFDGALTMFSRVGPSAPNQFIVALRNEDIRLVV